MSQIFQKGLDSNPRTQDNGYIVLPLASVGTKLMHIYKIRAWNFRKSEHASLLKSRGLGPML